MPKKTRAELMKDIDADYYGYRDEDDAVVVPLEKVAVNLTETLLQLENVKCSVDFYAFFNTGGREAGSGSAGGRVSIQEGTWPRR